METSTFVSSDAMRITQYHWRPADAPKAILHIIHGSIEHAQRYDRFARFLNAHGYLVTAIDQRGHGQTGVDNDALAIFSHQDDGWHLSLEDLHSVNQTLEREYPDLPRYMLGHSMGSFLVRHYVGIHGYSVQGAIIMGTGRASRWLTQTAQLVAKLLKRIGDKKRLTPFMHNLIYSPLNKAIDNPKTDYDFLSRDVDEVQKYIDDPLCGYTISVDYAHEMATGLITINDPQFIAQTRTDLPLLFVSGEADPVGGEKGSLVREVAQMYQASGNASVTVKLYEGARHEILNETNRDEVMADLLAWLDALTG